MKQQLFSSPPLEPPSPCFPLSLPNPDHIPLTTSSLEHVIFAGYSVWVQCRWPRLLCCCHPRKCSVGPGALAFPEPPLVVPVATYLQFLLDTLAGTLTCSLVHARVSRHLQLHPELIAFAPTLSSLWYFFREALEKPGSPLALTKKTSQEYLGSVSPLVSFFEPQPLPTSVTAPPTGVQPFAGPLCHYCASPTSPSLMLHQASA